MNKQEKPGILCVSLPCGYYGDAIKPCTCSPSAVTKYQKRVPGPLLDRIYIHVEVLRVDYQKLGSDRLEASSKTIQARVERARQKQRERFSSRKLNNVMHRRFVRWYRRCRLDACSPERRCGCSARCAVDEAGESLIRAAMGADELVSERVSPSAQAGTDDGPAREREYPGAAFGGGAARFVLTEDDVKRTAIGTSYQRRMMRPSGR